MLSVHSFNVAGYELHSGFECMSILQLSGYLHLESSSGGCPNPRRIDRSQTGNNVDMHGLYLVAGLIDVVPQNLFSDSMNSSDSYKSMTYPPP